MKKLYLVGMGVILLIILILALPQIAATCSWYAPLGASTSATLVLFQATGLGAIFGGLSVLYWKSLKEPPVDEDGGPEVGAPNSKPPTKMG
jgi:hypothetical protein